MVRKTQLHVTRPNPTPEIRGCIPQNCHCKILIYEFFIFGVSILNRIFSAVLLLKV